MPPPNQDHTTAFAAQLLELVHEATTTTSYKYAVLLALIELAQENVGRRGGPTGSVTTRQLAERVAALYWPQTRQHSSVGGVLRQLTRTQRSIADRIVAFRDRQGPRRSTTMHAARVGGPDAFEDLLDEIELVLIRYPIPLLQRMGGRDLPLLYRVSWKEGSPLGPVKSYQRALRTGGDTGATASPGAFDNLVRFLPHAEEHLATFAGLFRPLIRREWTRFVNRCNGDALEDLEDFLFEPTREDLSPIRPALVDLQSGECFYCHGRLGGAVEVDHFLPWSRCADNGIHNLVAAHNTCNNSKRDHLAASNHVQSWCTRIAREERVLTEVATAKSWPGHAERSLNLARSLYLQLPDEVPLWQARDVFEPSNTTSLERALGPR